MNKNHIYAAKTVQLSYIHTVTAITTLQTVVTNRNDDKINDQHKKRAL